MKSLQIALFSLFLCLVTALPVRAAEINYLQDIRDIPLMQGLTEATDESIVFDKPNGRIVETLATGDVHDQNVLDFYTATLPQLGWQQESETRYLRDGEVLTLSIQKKEGLTYVRFSLSPR